MEMPEADTLLFCVGYKGGKNTDTLQPCCCRALLVLLLLPLPGIESISLQSM
jgi:hypothetical protein